MITSQILATTLKHLQQRLRNFYSSIEKYPDDPAVTHWHEEVGHLNEAIRYFEAEREAIRQSTFTSESAPNFGPLPSTKINTEIGEDK